jgi:hypothetical protein
VGILRKDGAGNVLFEPADSPFAFMQPTPAIRVLHQDAQHTLLVGDRERTSDEMSELLHEDSHGRRKMAWWIIALIIAGAGLAFLGWYFYSHGLSTGNQTKF